MASLLIGVVCVAAPSFAAAPVKLSGAISGVVNNSYGVPQMGATILLLNRQDRALDKIQTNERGEFKFAGLFPDVYAIRVTLSSFLPAWKKDILVQPGMRSVLNISLSTLFSTIQLSYPTAIENGSIMSDDWKWVLRSATSTRPILRFAPVDSPQRTTQHVAAFSDTRGLLTVSAGEGSHATVGAEVDMATSFALATSLYGNNLLQVSGNVGYGSQTGAPAAAFRTSYSRNFAGGTPEVSVTMRQLFLPARVASSMGSNDAALPMLRSMSAGLDDSAKIADNVTVKYGFTMDSVSFLDHVNYFSPYARLTYSLGDGDEVQVTYTSGNARPDLGAAAAPEMDLEHDLNTLGIFPRVSLRGGRARVQRGEEYAVGYTKKVAHRAYSLTAYHEAVHNATLSMVAPGGMFAGGDILPDLFTGNTVFDIGNHANSGFIAAVTQQVGDHVSATVTYSTEGALTMGDRELVSNSPDELRSMIHSSRKHAGTARVDATAPHSGTHLIASYQWAGDRRWVMSGNLYNPDPLRPQPGLNIYVRQPLPRVASLPWRMEATADLRNMLAAGYLPLNTADGQRLLLVETPRSFRGGLSFIF
jgi:hypothetical protein